MSTKKWMLGMGAAAFLGALILGLYLAGLFDPAGKERAPLRFSNSGDVLPSPQGGEQESAKPKVITTSSFDPSKAGADSATSVSDEETGIQVWGVVEDPDGKPVSGARVDLFQDVGVIIDRPQEAREPSGTLITRASGSFSFRNLNPEDTYVLKVSHERYMVQRVHPIDPNRARTTQNLVVRMKPGLKITGTVFDDQGNPLKGAKVAVYDQSVQSMALEGQRERVAIVNQDGHYEALNLAPGIKKVIARMGDFAAAGRNGVNLRLPENGQNINLVLHAGFSLTGIVLDKDTQAPIKGATVTARPTRLLARSARKFDTQVPLKGVAPPRGRQRGRIPDAGGNPRRTVSNRYARIASLNFLIENAKTGKEGHFTLANLLNASYMIMVRAKGYQPSRAVNREAGSEQVTIQLTPAASVSGTVTDGETGKPVQKFSMAVTANAQLGTIPSKLRQRFHDQNGRFHYTDVAPGNMYILAEAKGYAGGRFGPIAMAVGQHVEDVVVRMMRGATLRGRVVEEGGDPVAGARVSLEQSVPGQDPRAAMFILFLQSRMRPTHKAVLTKQDGSFEMPHVLEGEYTLKVTHRAFSKGESVKVSCGNSGIVQVPDVLLKKGAVIKGVVLTKSGEPDTQASVMVSTADPGNLFSWSGNTDSHGRYECRGLKPGTYRVMVHKREGKLQIFEIFRNSQNPKHVVTVGEGQVLTLDL